MDKAVANEGAIVGRESEIWSCIFFFFLKHGWNLSKESHLVCQLKHNEDSNPSISTKMIYDLLVCYDNVKVGKIPTPSWFDSLLGHGLQYHCNEHVFYWDSRGKNRVLQKRLWWVKYLFAKLRVFDDGSASARIVPHRPCKDDTLAVFLASFDLFFKIEIPK